MRELWWHTARRRSTISLLLLEVVVVLEDALNVLFPIHEVRISVVLDGLEDGIVGGISDLSNGGDYLSNNRIDLGKDWSGDFSHLCHGVEYLGGLFLDGFCNFLCLLLKFLKEASCHLKAIN